VLDAKLQNRLIIIRKIIIIIILVSLSSAVFERWWSHKNRSWSFASLQFNSNE